MPGNVKLITSLRCWIVRLDVEIDIFWPPVRLWSVPPPHKFVIFDRYVFLVIPLTTIGTIDESGSFGTVGLDANTGRKARLIGI
jgi:hypothetical protein